MKNFPVSEIADDLAVLMSMRVDAILGILQNKPELKSRNKTKPLAVIRFFRKEKSKREKKEEQLFLNF